MEPTDQSAEAAAIMGVIARESEAFWNKDHEAWAQRYVHAPYMPVIG